MKNNKKQKCTYEEAVEFSNLVWEFLEKEKLPYSKIQEFQTYNGNVRVYTGYRVERLSRYKAWLASHPKQDPKEYKPKIEEQYFFVQRMSWTDDKFLLKEWLLTQKLKNECRRAEEVRNIKFLTTAPKLPHNRF